MVGAMASINPQPRFQRAGGWKEDMENTTNTNDPTKTPQSLLTGSFEVILGLHEGGMTQPMQNLVPEQTEALDPTGRFSGLIIDTMFILLSMGYIVNNVVEIGEPVPATEQEPVKGRFYVIAPCTCYQHLIAVDILDPQGSVDRIKSQKSEWLAGKGDLLADVGETKKVANG